MIIRIDASLALPVYEQIRDQVTRMVVSGTMSEGSRLPTIRQLATDLGIAKGTVAKSYALLELDKIVESRGRNGTVVLPLDPTLPVDVAELDDHAISYMTAARQLGASVDQAIDALRRHWIEA